MRGVCANGDTIRRIRRRLAITQEQLAGLAGCDCKTIRKAEQGRDPIDLRIIDALAMALGVEATELMASDTPDDDRSRWLIQRVEQWAQAVADGDIERLLAMHTEDTILELPGTEALPAAGGGTVGKGALRDHFVNASQIIRLIDIDLEKTHIRVAGDRVYMRTTATFEFIPAGKGYTTQHVNEFEFRGDLIARRVTVADYEDLRQIINEYTASITTNR